MVEGNCDIGNGGGGGRGQSCQLSDFERGFSDFLLHLLLTVFSIAFSSDSF